MRRHRSASLIAALSAAFAAAQGVVPPYSEQFEAPTWPGAEWVRTTTSANGRVVPMSPSPASPSGGLAANFDVSVTNVYSTNTLTLTVDLVATAGGVLSYRAKETSDETDVEDGLFLASTPAGPFVKVVDHATLTSAWQTITLDLASAAASNGLAVTANFQVRFQQRDNYPVPTDGLQVDDVRVDPPPVQGQANAANALLDVNNGLNAFGFAALAGTPGPFFAEGVVGGPLTLRVTGPVNRPYALLAGPLGVANLVVTGVGSLDLGLLGPASVADVLIVLDGTQPGFLNGLANTGPSGVSTISLTTPALPAGAWTAFQAVVFVDAVTVKLTAAFEFTVL